MEMIFPFLFLVVSFFSYLTFVVFNVGILPSISESYYRLPKQINWLFTLFCWSIAFSAIVLGNTVLMFVAGAGICFVGTAAAFKEKMIDTIHTVGAVIGILASQLAIFFDFNLPIINIISISLMILIFLGKKIIKNQIWWIEIAAFSAIIVALYLKYF